MATGKTKPKELEPQDEIARLLALQLRRAVGNQGETIQELNRVGFGQTRIAQLLGTTPGTVNQELIRAKKKPVKKNTP